ncbi:MAG: ABC transporter ATP-binding protein [Oscillospiraceae bacterium]|jgi:ABC-2 type transport system ATP-binding protein|nr:ABC transporter ATP-binding protein [Oscillospiraceae bacterium]
MSVLASVNSLTVCYGQTVAAHDVSFDIGEGEIVVMIGPNGSGKTTIAECLEGLRKPTTGSINVFGKDPLTHRKEIYPYLGVQLQEADYPDKIKVEELCRLFSSFYAAPADYQKLLEQLDLYEKRNRYVRKLSGGEKQRLSVLLALLPRPKLLILDELTTGLDPEVRRNMWDSLAAVRDAGVGILLISHYMDEVAALANRIVFMLNGKCIYSGGLAGLKTYAEETLSPEDVKPDMSLEEIYLALVPKKGRISLEAIL